MKKTVFRILAGIGIAGSPEIAFTQKYPTGQVGAFGLYLYARAVFPKKLYWSIFFVTPRSDNMIK